MVETPQSSDSTHASLAVSELGSSGSGPYQYSRDSPFAPSPFFLLMASVA